MKIRISLRDAIVVIGVIFFPIAIIWGVLDVHKMHKELKEDGKYSIGITTSESYMAGHHRVYYTFRVKGVKYYGEVHPTKFSYIISGHYFVKYSTNNPKYNEMINVAVPDSAKAPENGWDSIPGRRYGAGRIENIFSNNKTTIEFNYKIKTLYIITATNFLTLKDVGKTYYLSFFPGNPVYDLKVYNKIVPDSVYLNAPEGGWVKKPW